MQRETDIFLQEFVLHTVKTSNGILIDLTRQNYKEVFKHMIDALTLLAATCQEKKFLRKDLIR